ncbi:MAG: hypothetical protein [Caudoviricetes sp.]|nr:MAG: hypothetical protein [Caudoviricetes sp.]
MNKYLEKAVELHGDEKYGKHPFSYHLLTDMKTSESIFGYSNLVACVSAFHDALESDVISVHSLRDWLIHQPELDLYDVDFNILPALDAITKRERESRNEYLIRVKGSRLAKQVKIADAMSNLRQNILDKNLKRAAYYQDTLDKLLEV